MNGSRLCVDTNILLYFLNGDADVVEMLSDKIPVISIISELEMLSYPLITPESEKTIQGLLANCVIVDISHDIKHHAIEIRRRFSLKLPDAIIAATALEQTLPLLTADKQFLKLREQPIILFEV